jgi:outer membrane lipoprotein LolB
MDGKGSVGQFDWAHRLNDDLLSVNSPLGTTVARLQRDPAGVSLQADGKTWQATDVESLTQDVLGWTLPLGNLVWWIRGLPAPMPLISLPRTAVWPSRAGPSVSSAMPTYLPLSQAGGHAARQTYRACCRKTGIEASTAIRILAV